MSLTHDDNKFERRGDSININIPGQTEQTFDNRDNDDHNKLTFSYNPNANNM